MSSDEKSSVLSQTIDLRQSTTAEIRVNPPNYSIYKRTIVYERNVLEKKLIICLCTPQASCRWQWWKTSWLRFLSWWLSYLQCTRRSHGHHIHYMCCRSHQRVCWCLHIHGLGQLQPKGNASNLPPPLSLRAKLRLRIMAKKTIKSLFILIYY